MDICFLGNTDSILTRRWIESFKDDFEVSVISLGEKTVQGVRNYNIHMNKKIPASLPRTMKITETSPGGSLKTRKKIHFTRFTQDLIGLVTEIIRNLEPKIMHAHYLTDYGFIASESGRKPLISQAYGSDVYITPWQSSENEQRARGVIEKSDILLTVAKTMKKHLIKLGCKENKIKYVPLCTDVGVFDPKKTAPHDNELKVVLSFRKLNPLYDIDTFVRAIPIVLNELRDVKFVIAGRGTEENNLKSLCKSLGISESVDFIGEVPYSEMPDIINQADVCVSTALSDGTPNSVCEAMSMEKGVIATAVGDLPYIIKEGDTGILIPPKSPEMLADKVIYLLKSDTFRERMGKRARASIIKNYNWKKWRKIMKRIYSDFL